MDSLLIALFKCTGLSKGISKAYHHLVKEGAGGWNRWRCGGPDFSSKSEFFFLTQWASLLSKMKRPTSYHVSETIMLSREWIRAFLQLSSGSMLAMPKASRGIILLPSGVQQGCWESDKGAPVIWLRRIHSSQESQVAHRRKWRQASSLQLTGLSLCWWLECLPRALQNSCSQTKLAQRLCVQDLVVTTHSTGATMVKAAAIPNANEPHPQL